MPEELKDPAENPTETGEKKPEVKSPTLEDIASQNKELNEKLEKVLKQNSDKDSFITKLQSENKEIRGALQKVSETLEGKSNVQKDAILERQKQAFLKEGYDEKSVDLILNTIVEISDRKAQEKIVPLIMDAAQELVESDTEIDKDFLEKNQEEITSEYTLFKPETSPRKIKQNLKKAYSTVKERLTEKAKASTKGKDEKVREDMLAGGKVEPSAKKPPTDDDFIKSIEGAGSSNSHFI